MSDHLKFRKHVCLALKALCHQMSDYLKFRKHVCLALKALCHRKPGASPQESLSAKAPALKARFKSRHWFSIPNITFVEIHAMPAQYLPVFLLKRPRAMVLLLLMCVSQYGIELTR